MADPIKYVPYDAIQRLLAKLRPLSTRDFAIFTVAFWRGLRASEVGLLRMEDWRGDVGRLFVRRLKGSISGEYTVGPEESRAIKAWLKVRGNDPGPLFPSRKQCAIGRGQLHALTGRYGALAGWPEDKRHFHVLRHSIAVHLVERGIDILAIKDWLGHRSISSTMVYAQVTSKVRDAVADQVFNDGKERVKVNWKGDKK
jgi:integrase